MPGAVKRTPQEAAQYAELRKLAGTEWHTVPVDTAFAYVVAAHPVQTV